MCKAGLAEVSERSFSDLCVPRSSCPPTYMVRDQFSHKCRHQQGQHLLGWLTIKKEKKRSFLCPSEVELENGSRAAPSTLPCSARLESVSGKGAASPSAGRAGTGAEAHQQEELSICSPAIRAAPSHIQEIFMDLLLGQFLWPRIKS